VERRPVVKHHLRRHRETGEAALPNCQWMQVEHRLVVMHQRRHHCEIVEAVLPNCLFVECCQVATHPLRCHRENRGLDRLVEEEGT